MIVSQRELDLIANPKIRRRMMRLPVKHGPHGERRLCPLRYGHTYRLQACRGGPVEVVTVTCEPRVEKLAALAPADAEREGYAGIQGALAGWADRHGSYDEATQVWVVAFARDRRHDTAEFLAQRDTVFLAAANVQADYTTQPSRGLRGELAVLDPVVAKRVTQEEHERQREAQRAALQTAGHLETLRRTIADMKLRQAYQQAARTIRDAAGAKSLAGAVEFAEGSCQENPELPGVGA